MNGRIDVIEVLRLANPVPPESIGEQVRLSAERRASLRVVPTDVPVTWPESDAQTRWGWPKYAAVITAVAAGVAAFVLVPRWVDRDGDLASTPDTTTAASPYVGVWLSVDHDGSSQTMEIVESASDELQVVLHDDSASEVCAGAPATVTGSGRLDTDGSFVVAEPALTCDDGTIPPQGGPVIVAFAHDPAADEIVDAFGVVWRREGVTTTTNAPTSEAMWPQTSMEEVREAQRLADAADPGFTWQVDTELVAQSSPLSNVELVTRFLEEELGWEEFRWRGVVGVDFGDGSYDNIVYMRCAPGRTNPVYPTDPEGGECAPTIDDLRYETVSIDIAQLVRQDATGVWVVTRWQSIEPERQAVPASDAEATDFLEGYLAARVAGTGDEQYIISNTTIPLRHATTAGAPYERFDIESISDPRWPSGERETTLRLFADGGATVVEQRFVMTVDGVGRLGLEYTDAMGSRTGTTENGRSVAVPVSYQLFAGAVAFAAAPPWGEALWSAYFSDNLTTLTDFSAGYFSVMADPRPVGADCEAGALAVDAVGLALALRSDPDLQATEPVTERIAGVDAVVVDVAALDGATVCDWWGAPLVLGDLPENADDVSDPETPRGLPLGSDVRMRLYLLDEPGGSGRVLAIAVFAPEERFAQVVASVAPILDSFDFEVEGN